MVDRKKRRFSHREHRGAENFLRTAERVVRRNSLDRMTWN